MCKVGDLKPYYEHAGITIYHGDCLDLLPRLGRFDFVATDAPFGIGDAPRKIGARRGKARRGSDNVWHDAGTWDKRIEPAWCEAVCLAAPVVAWFGFWRMRPMVKEAMPHPMRDEIVWSKDMHCGPPQPTARRDERIWLFAEKPFKPTRFETSVWDEPVIPTWSHKHHKNEKPKRLMTRLLAWLPGDNLCDPFMGSGTTLVAAKELGLKATGIEINERYCEIAVKRLSQEMLPGVA